MSVFINCPFDDAYSPLFDSIIFAIVACGFNPRAVLDSGDGLRLDRITAALLGSRYSIHDLTRCMGEGTSNLARFNMPLELGMAIAFKALSPAAAPHEWFVMVPKGRSYFQFISDLSGFDLAEHDETKRAVIYQKVAWLWLKGLSWKPTPQRILDHLPSFERSLRTLRSKFAPARPPWSEIVLAAIANKPD